MVGGRDGEEDQLAMPHDKLARAMWEERITYLEARYNDLNLTRAIKRRSLGPSTSEAAATSTHARAREVARARNVNS